MIFSSVSEGQLKFGKIYVENKTNPCGIDVDYPRLSWQLTSDRRDVSQSAFDIRVSESLTDLLAGNKLIFHTGKIPSEQSVYVLFTGNTLDPMTKYYWQVKVWDDRDKESKWSNPSWWIMGMRNPQNWTAQWMASGVPDALKQGYPLFRKEFTIAKKIKQATVCISAQGCYRAFINGKKIGKDWYTPGWTSYSSRLDYQTYDVTNLLHEGINASGLRLVKGWYSGTVGPLSKEQLYGHQPAAIFQLQIWYDDGSSSQIVSDGSWRSASGPLQKEDLYNGELFDARKKLSGWLFPRYNDRGWYPVSLADAPVTRLVAREREGVVVRKIHSAVRILTTAGGKKVYDFGKNMTGFVQLQMHGQSGDTVSVNYAETMRPDGEMDFRNQRDRYVLRGDSAESFDPEFSCHHFRYACLTGMQGKVVLVKIRACELGTAMDVVGAFRCSDELVNQFQTNIQQTLGSNFLTIPRSGTGRYDQMGWTGPVQLVATTAAVNYRVHSFLDEWLKNLSVDQDTLTGKVPLTVPDYFRDGRTSPGWGDAAVLVPWELYLEYGDRTILADHYRSMKSWCDYICRQSPDHCWTPDFAYGDWLFVRPPTDDYGETQVTDHGLIAQCYAVASFDALVRTALVLGKNKDADLFQQQKKLFQQQFLREYVTPSGRLVSETQTAYVLALQFDLLPDNMRAMAAGRLVKLIQARQFHLSCGILGAAYICQVLSRFGYADVAYNVMLQKSYPGWLYPVTMGATTVWKYWNSVYPDGHVADRSGNSLNNIALAGVGNWFFRVVAGILPDPAKPGYKHIIIRPVPEEKLHYAQASLETYYGRIFSGWKFNDHGITYTVSIPVNTSADVYLPVGPGSDVREDGRKLTARKEIKIFPVAGNDLHLAIGSGTYTFEVRNP